MGVPPCATIHLAVQLQTRAATPAQVARPNILCGGGALRSPSGLPERLLRLVPKTARVGGSRDDLQRRKMQHVRTLAKTPSPRNARRHDGGEARTRPQGQHVVPRRERIGVLVGLPWTGTPSRERRHLGGAPVTPGRNIGRAAGRLAWCDGEVRRPAGPVAAPKRCTDRAPATQWNDAPAPRVADAWTATPACGLRRPDGLQRTHGLRRSHVLCRPGGLHWAHGADLMACDDPMACADRMACNDPDGLRLCPMALPALPASAPWPAATLVACAHTWPAANPWPAATHGLR